MIKLGVTGGIGSGKSIVCKIFETFGVPVYEADSRAKYLLNTSQNIQRSVVDLLGSEVYKEGVYDSKEVGNVVFKDKKKLLALNAIVHPAVAVDWLEWCERYNKRPLLIKEAAIMKKDGLDFILFVHCEKEIRIQRVLKRDDHRTKESVESIISKQMNESEFRAIADFEIDNSGVDLVIPQVVDIYNQLLSV